MRKTKEVTITAEGRDKGKRFLITEMAASRAERWANRALLAVSQSGIKVPPHMLGMGMAGIVAIGVQSILLVEFAEANALLDEMMGCIQFMPDPARPDFARAVIEDGVNDEIEEVYTRYLLRSEVFELHTGFSIAAYLRERAAAQATDETTSDT